MSQFILYSANDLDRWRDPRRRGVMPDALSSLLSVLGEPRRLRAGPGPPVLPRRTPPGAVDGVRLSDGTLAADNTEAVWAAAAAAFLARPPADADGARSLLNTPQP